MVIVRNEPLFTSGWKKYLENREKTLSRKIPFLIQNSYFQIGQRQIDMWARLSGKNDVQVKNR